MYILTFQCLTLTRVPQNTYSVRTENCQWTELNWEFSTVTSMH